MHCLSASSLCATKTFHADLCPTTLAPDPGDATVSRRRPEQLPESARRDVGDADFRTSRRRGVADLFIVPRRPLLLLLLTAML